ncbi:hypothetical protein CMI39_03100 [Candidatus Pacearchaeota archaeon]|jgi:hypothetical protein|nr:hypothetical protein [Candidatus Pacearchaeota archaeon]|tara:strand:- start:1489 stop:1959 length:471 start_codon:yes stop_codon:yes gene_type:complete
MKKAQEEMIGFALIVIVVAVIILVFIGFSLKSPQKETVESYEINSFIQSFLQQTSDCRDNLEYLSVQKLIFDCNNNEICKDGRNTCEVLDSTLTGITEESWKIKESPIKGYNLEIISEGVKTLTIEKGNITTNLKGSSQDFSKGGGLTEIFFKVYY